LFYYQADCLALGEDVADYIKLQR